MLDVQHISYGPRRWYVAFVLDEGSPFPLRYSAFRAESNCSVIQSGLLRCWGKLLCMRASAVSNANTRVTWVRGQPCIQGCITGKEWRKIRLMFIFDTICQQKKKKIYCPLQHPLKGWIGPTAGAVNLLWDLLLPNLETLCNWYSLVSLALSSPWTSHLGASLRVLPVGPDGKFFSEGLSTTV